LIKRQHIERYFTLGSELKKLNGQLSLYTFLDLLKIKKPSKNFHKVCDYFIKIFEFNNQDYLNPEDLTKT